MDAHTAAATLDSKARRWAEQYRQAIEVVMDAYLRSGVWPRVDELQQKLHAAGSDLDLWAFSDALRGERCYGIGSLEPSEERIKLRLRAWHDLKGLDPYVDFVLLAARTAVRRYLAGSRVLAATDLQEMRTLDDFSWRIVMGLIEQEAFYFLAGVSTLSTRDWEAQIDRRRIGRFRSMTTIEDYLLAVAELHVDAQPWVWVGLVGRADAADDVLKATAELLDRPDTQSVATAEVLGALGWSADRREEVLDMLVQLVEQGYLRGPRGGPLRGDNRILDIDVLGVTPKGRARLAEASEPRWLRVGETSHPQPHPFHGEVTTVTNINTTIHTAGMVNINPDTVNVIQSQIEAIGSREPELAQTLARLTEALDAAEFSGEQREELRAYVEDLTADLQQPPQRQRWSRIKATANAIADLAPLAPKFLEVWNQVSAMIPHSSPSGLPGA
jgi:hypothetical protein